jgi:hypothetical protein
MTEKLHTHERLHEDRRAHNRIDELEDTVQKIHVQINQFEHLLSENTALTKQIVVNTAAIVELVKGAKGLRTFVVWVAPIVAAGIALIAWLRSH